MEKHMTAIVKRTIGKYTHFLNCINGQIVSFGIDNAEAEEIMNKLDKYEFDCEAEKVFKNIDGQYNSRLCRKNLIKLGLEFNFPTMVNIELSRRCSLRCMHCYVGNKNLSSDELSFFEKMNESDIDEFLSSLKNLGVFLVVITGGEPFISKNLKRFLKAGTEKGFLMEIFSNLQHLPDWFRTSEYSDFRIGRIQTSVYSSENKVHDKVTRSVGSFERNIRNLQFLKEKGYFLEAATPLMKANFSSWESTMLFFKQQIGIAQNFSWPIVNEYYSSNRKRKSSLNISSRNFKDFIGKNPDFLLETRNTDPDKYVCEAGKAIFAISATGDVFPCSQLPLAVGNMTQEKIKEIFCGGHMAKIASLRWKEVTAKKVFNFCPGANYSDAGNILTQPEHMLKAIKSVYCDMKGGEKK